MVGEGNRGRNEAFASLTASTEHHGRSRAYRFSNLRSHGGPQNGPRVRSACNPIHAVSDLTAACHGQRRRLVAGVQRRSWSAHPRGLRYGRDGFSPPPAWHGKVRPQGNCRLDPAVRQQQGHGLSVLDRLPLPMVALGSDRGYKSTRDHRLRRSIRPSDGPARGRSLAGPFFLPAFPSRYKQK